MKTMPLILMIVVVLIAGCNKNKKDTTNASAVDSLSSSSSDDAKKLKNTPAQAATGKMRELLLALKRVHFGFDTATLAANSKRDLDEAAEKLRSITDVALYVDGHTDERGTTEYNMSLGERRAKTVVDYLKNSGVESNRLNIVSFGEEKPVVNGAGEREYAENRRVEYRLMRGNVQFVLEDSDLVADDGTLLSSR